MVQVRDTAAAVRAALDEGGPYLDPVVVEEARETVDRALARLELGPEHTVVALVGATGSGKSSLFNALARMDIAEVGARRPLTSLPMACVWGEGGSSELLDWLQVPLERRMNRETVLDADQQAPLHGLVLLDLPDHDSTEVVHRVEVDRLVKQVDLLVWVVDPQKYADDALHSGYLQRMSSHDGVMVVVLNQIDRLGPDEAETCRRDLRRLLDGDGLQAVRVVPVSARRGDGVDDLRELLADVVQDHGAIEQRLSADLATSVSALSSQVGLTSASVVDADRLVGELSDAAGVPTVLDAVSAEYRRRGRARADWPVLRGLQLLRSRTRRGPASGDDDDLRVIASSLAPMFASSQRPRVELAVDAFVSAQTRTLPRRWADGVRSAAGSSGDLVPALDEAVAGVDLELDPPAWWRVIGVVQWLLTTMAVAGLVWSVVALIAGSGLALPLTLLLVGLLGGAVLAFVTARVLVGDARRRRLSAQERMDNAVASVAAQQVIAPVRSVLEQHARTRLALAGPASAPAPSDDDHDEAGTALSSLPTSSAGETSRVPVQSDNRTVSV